MNQGGKGDRVKKSGKGGRIGVEEEISARRWLRMLIDRYPKEDIFARVPKMTERIDPVLQHLDETSPRPASHIPFLSIGLKILPGHPQPGKMRIRRDLCSAGKKSCVDLTWPCIR